MKFDYLAQIDEQGRLRFPSYSSMCAALKLYAGRDVLVTIQEAPSIATLGQRGFWFAVVLTAMHQAMQEDGNCYDREQVRNVLKELFGPRNQDGSVKSMSEYQKADWQTMIERCMDYGIHEMRINFPTREEQA